MNELYAWIAARPALAAAITWVCVTALTWIFKARSPEEYDRMPPRLAAFLQLLGALFGDGRKIIEAAGKVFSGKSRPPARGVAHVHALAVLALVSAAVLVVVACTPHSQAATATMAARIEQKRLEYDAAVMACADPDAGAVRCADVNACQRRVSLEYGLPQRGSCVELTPAEARDAGLL